MKLFLSASHQEKVHLFHSTYMYNLVYCDVSFTNHALNLPTVITTTNFPITGVTVIAKDEHPRPDTKMETLHHLKPSFIKDGTGTVTAGNASGINDGAAVVMVMTHQNATNHLLPPLAKIVTWAQAGVDPSVMGTGPIPAIKTAVSTLL